MENINEARLVFIRVYSWFLAEAEFGAPLEFAIA